MGLSTSSTPINEFAYKKNIYYVLLPHKRKSYTSNWFVSNSPTYLIPSWTLQIGLCHLQKLCIYLYARARVQPTKKSDE